jgi:hypothetical protein
MKDGLYGSSFFYALALENGGQCPPYDQSNGTLIGGHCPQSSMAFLNLELLVADRLLIR